MADNSKIEWTDATWNPVRGCTRVSPGCGGPRHEGGCYAEKIAARFSDPGQPFHGFAERTQHGGRWTGKLALVEDKLIDPLRWRRPRRVFVNSMSDLFHENLSNEAIAAIFGIMAAAPQHTFQVLTKRSARMRAWFDWHAAQVRAQDCRCEPWRICESEAQNFVPDLPAIGCMQPWPLKNVWLGVSVEDQTRADERRDDLNASPAAVKFVSYEPALSAVDWTGWEFLDWLIAGGESGPKARPAHPDWFRAARDFCRQHDIAFFFKQWGVWAPCAESDGFWPADTMNFCRIGADGRRGDPHGWPMQRVGKALAGRLLDSVTHDAMPEMA